MGTNVYANGMEIACKASSGKSVAAFPDVCFTPPQAPPTPPGVPIPYPNNGMASDATDGSKSVTIKGKEVMLKNKSYFKKSTGDEAGNAGKKGVVSSTNTGKVYFTSWSMNVKIEGENVVRHLDMTTHNHGSMPGNAPPWPFLAEMNPEINNIEVCKDDAKRVNEACQNSKPPKCDDACTKAQKCILAPKKLDKKLCCSTERTGHHLLEVHCFTPTGGRGKRQRLKGFEGYNDNDAPCVCASQSRHAGTHRILHAVQGKLEAAYDMARSAALKVWPGAGKLLPGGERGPGYSKWTYKEARDAGVKAHSIAFPDCNPECVEKQLDQYHKDKCGMKDDTPLRTDPEGGGRTPDDFLADGDKKKLADAVRDAVRNAQGEGSLGTIM